MKKLNKKCKCGNFIRDEYDLCDNCLLKKYGLELKGFHLEYYDILFTREDVIEALRRK